MKRISYKAYNYRLLPTLEQRISFSKTFGCVRFIWNQMLGYAALMKNMESMGIVLLLTKKQKGK